jgi:hypothetical protein
VWSGFVLLAGALLLTVPLLAVAPIDPLPIGAPQPIVVHFALAGAVLWACRTLTRRGKLSGPVAGWFDDRPWLPLRQVGAVGLAAAGADRVGRRAGASSAACSCSPCSTWVWRPTPCRA